MNYEQVIKDYDSGTINRDHWTLVMDNDDGYWRYTGPEVKEETEEKLCDDMKEKYGTPGGYSDVVDILQAAGVESEWC